MKELTIYVDTSDEAMVGGPGWEGYDPTESKSAFMDQVMDAALKAFPDAAITIKPTTHGTNVETDELAQAPDLIEQVRHLINQVWERQEWYRE